MEQAEVQQVGQGEGQVKGQLGEEDGQHRPQQADENHVHKEGEAPPGESDPLPFLVGLLVYLVTVRQNLHQGAGEDIAQKAAQGVAEQVVHVKEAVGPGIVAVQAGELGQLEKQADAQRDEHRREELAPEIIPQVKAQGH